MLNPLYFSFDVISYLIYFGGRRPRGFVLGDEAAEELAPKGIPRPSVGGVVHYSLSFNEDFLADLTAIEFTRHPKALYTIFEKLRLQKPSFFEQDLPRQFYYLYFTGEGMLKDEETPMPQPPIEERKRLLERLDLTLKGLRVISDSHLHCPHCGYKMEEVGGKKNRKIEK